jgi:hypothetical protein
LKIGGSFYLKLKPEEARYIRSSIVGRGLGLRRRQSKLKPALFLERKQTDFQLLHLFNLTKFTLKRNLHLTKPVKETW